MRPRAATPSLVADRVRDFYDSHPYPPPVTSLDDYRRLWEDVGRRRADHHLFFPDQSYRGKQAILVAGCGTSQAAKYALREPAAAVVAIDVSATSISHTRELKERYRLANLEIYQLPIEQVHELERSFDKIVCTGVLHHLPSPEAGLRALRDVLDPQGAMHLMVYARYGRAGIYMLQEYCRRLGVESTDDEIQELAETLLALPERHPLRHLLAESPDFRTKAGLADALLNPNDRAYTVPQLFDFIDGSGLVFGRWLRQAPYLPQCGVLAETPHATRLRRLSAQEQFAAMELFRGTMVRHSAIVYHNDREGTAQPIRFDDETWLDYVPIRLFETRCLEERLPDGAAAVLLNRAHSYTDIYLPIDAAQKRLFETIDGERTIGEIVKSSSTPAAERSREGAGAFFEQLWCYDQVVFDLSPARQNLRRADQPMPDR